MESVIEETVRVIEERERLWQERDTLQHRLEELSDSLWDAVKKESQLLRGHVTLLEDSLAAVREEAARESTL